MTLSSTLQILTKRFAINTALLGLLIAPLGACSGDGVLGTGIGGGSSSSSSSSSGSSGGGPLSTARNYLLYGGATVPAPAASNPGDRDINCPKISVLEGTAGMRIGSTTGGASEVSYQASLGETARECKIEGNTVVIKVGVEGRLLIGTIGKPGSYVVPLRIVVKREKVVLYSKLVRLNVTIAPNDTQAGFTHVEEGIVLPLTENDPADEYDLLVGFDPNGKDPNAKAEPRKARRRS